MIISHLSINKRVKIGILITIYENNHDKTYEWIHILL